MGGGGISNPSGAFSDAVEGGAHARVGLQLGVPLFPLALRAEGEAHRFEEKAGGGDTTVLAGTVSAVLALGGIGLVPYVLGGIGSYRTEASSGPVVAKRGYHAGFGVNVGALGLGAFAEVRIVNIPAGGMGDDTRFIPVTVGLRF